MAAQTVKRQETEMVGIQLSLGATRRREGFERKHLAEKQQLYNVAHASNGEVRSLTYVIEDNYPAQARAASQLRSLAMEAGAILAGLIRSTRSRGEEAGRT